MRTSRRNIPSGATHRVRRLWPAQRTPKRVELTLVIVFACSVDVRSVMLTVAL